MGKSLGAGRRLRQTVFQHGYAVGTEEVIKSDAGIEEMPKALADKARGRLGPEPHPNHAHCPARQRGDDAGLQHGRKVALLRLAIEAGSEFMCRTPAPHIRSDAE